MNKRRIPRPTDGELEILQVLWDRGPSTVRQVHESLCRNRRTGYTTVLKLLQIMFEKGLVVRDESQRSHVYRPRCQQQQTQRHLVNDLVAKAFGGSVDDLVMQALKAKKVSEDELTQVRNLLDELGGDAS